MSQDDPIAIPDETRLFRRIPSLQIVWDDNKKERRPSSQCFNDSSDRSPMSVFAENIARAHDEKPEDFLHGKWISCYLAFSTAEDMRKLTLEVFPDPDILQPPEHFESHSAVKGKKNKTMRHDIAQRFNWEIAPPDRYDPPK